MSVVLIGPANPGMGDPDKYFSFSGIGAFGVMLYDLPIRRAFENGKLRLVEDGGKAVKLEKAIKSQGV